MKMRNLLKEYSFDVSDQKRVWSKLMSITAEVEYMKKEFRKNKSVAPGNLDAIDSYAKEIREMLTNEKL